MTPSFSAHDRSRPLVSGAHWRATGRTRSPPRQAGRSPRETIALVLIEECEALAELVRNLIKSGAAGDLRAAQTLVRYLDQGLGRVEESKGQQSTEDTAISDLTREERAAMAAKLRADRASGEG